MKVSKIFDRGAWMLHITDIFGVTVKEVLETIGLNKSEVEHDPGEIFNSFLRGRYPHDYKDAWDYCDDFGALKVDAVTTAEDGNLVYTQPTVGQCGPATCERARDTNSCLSMAVEFYGANRELVVPVSESTASRF